MAYTPPAGNNVALDFQAGYTPPAGDNVALDFGVVSNILLPVSISDGAFGSPTLTSFSLSQDLFPFAIFPGSIGSHTIYNNAQLVFPLSFFAGAYGTPNIKNYLQYVYGIGLFSEQPGFPSIRLQYRFVYPTSAEYVGWGTANIILRNKTIYPGVFPTLTTYGTAFVENKNRSMFPSGFNPTSFGTHTIYNLKQIKQMQGFTQAALGVPYIVGPRYLFPPGFAATLFVPTNTVEYLNRTVRPSSVIPEYFPPGTPKIDTRNRYLPVTGFDSSAVGDPIVAMPPFTIIDVLNQSINESAMGSNVFVTRFIYGGLNLSGRGIPPGSFGTARLFPHYIRPTGGAFTGFGTTWISNKIRYLNAASLGVMVRFGTAWLSNYVRYLEPTGFDQSRVFDPYGPLSWPIPPPSIGSGVSPGVTRIYPDGFEASGVTYDHCGYPRIPEVPRPSVTQ